jgi:hypothetical protein
LHPLTSLTRYRGEFEERLKNVVEEVTQSNDTILFIDELHTLVGAGAAEGAIDAANILKPALARGELQCIGATTLTEYRQYIEKDAALERRFQPVEATQHGLCALLIHLARSSPHAAWPRAHPLAPGPPSAAVAESGCNLLSPCTLYTPLHPLMIGAGAERRGDRGNPARAAEPLR